MRTNPEKQFPGNMPLRETRHEISRFSITTKSLTRIVFQTEILILPLLLVSSVFADIVPGASSSTVNYHAFAGAGSLSQEREDTQPGTTLEDGTFGIEYTSQFTLADDFEISNFSGDFDVYLYNNHRITQTSPQFVTVQGLSESVLSASGSGSHADESNYTQTLGSQNPGNQSIFGFVVTTDDTPVKIVVSSAGAANSSTFILQKFEGGVWNAVVHLGNFTSNISISRFDFLSAGQYRTFAAVSTDLSKPEGTIRYELEIGEAPGSEILPPQGDYTAPGVGNFAKNSSKLQVVTPAIESETDLGNGTTRLVVSANLVNSSLCPWERVELMVPGLLSETSLVFRGVPATSTVATADRLTVTVETAELAATRAGILDGSLFASEGLELIVFRYPVVVMGQSDVTSWQAAKAITPEELTFTNDQPTGIALEWEPIFRIPPIELQGPPGPALRQGLDALLPYLVSESRQVPTLLGSYYQMFGSQRLLTDLVKHGTIRSTVSYDVPGSVVPATEGGVVGRQSLFPTAHPIHFNEILIGDLVKLSGNFAFNPGEFSVNFEMENFDLKEFSVTVNYSADLNILLETANAGDNTGDPLFQQEKTIFDVPLFEVVTPMGITFSPKLSLDVGAAVNAPSSLSVPMTSRFEVKMTAGVRNGAAFYEDSSTYTPIRLSDPGMFEDLEATATVWANAEILARVGFGGTVGAGPTFGAKATGTFTLDPLDNPWWSLEADLDLTAGVEFDIAGLVTLYDTSRSLKNFSIIDIDAGGPLLGAGARGFAPPKPGISPLSGKTTRWARSYRVGENMVSDYRNLFACKLVGTEDIIAGGGNTVTNDLSRIGPDGTLLWSRKASNTLLQPLDAVGDPDGGFTLLDGSGGRVGIARLSAAGESQWSRSFSATGVINYKSRTLLRNADGYFIVGIGYIAGKYRMIVSHLDAAGNLVWQKQYRLPDGNGGTSDIYPQDAVLTGDGHLVVCAETPRDFADADILVNVTNNGLLAKISLTDGSLRWSELLAQIRNCQYRAMAMDPDGNFYVAGQTGRTFIQDDPQMTVLKFDPLGKFIDSAMIGYRGSEYSDSISETGDLLSALPHGGETSWDIAHDIVWAGDSLWIGGQMGIFNSSLASADGSAAITAQLETNLSVSRFAVHGGKSSDHFSRLLDGTNGLVCVGASRSFDPWPNGSSGESDDTDWSRLVMKLPWEGVVRFHEISNGHDGLNAGSFFIFPRVTSGKVMGLFPALEEASMLEALDLTSTESAVTSNFIAESPLVHHGLEFQPRSLIVDQQSYLDWHQMNGEDDNDGDGMDAVTEFFHGTDPAAGDAVTATTAVGDDFTLGFPRSKLAESVIPLLQDSGDLDAWFPRTDFTLESFPLDAERDWIELNIPRAEGELLRFYRFAVPRY